MASDNKIQLVFIINGEPTPVAVNVNPPLHVAVRDALRDSGNSGRKPEDWELRDAQGVLIDLNRSASDFGLASGATLFLTLKVGAGG